MNTAILLLLSTIGTVGHETVIDDFQYQNNSSAQATWGKSTWGSSEIKVVTDGNRKVLRVNPVFGDKESLERVTIDGSLKKILTSFSQFQIEIKLLSPPTGERIALYLRSGDGWYVGGATVKSSGWQNLIFTPSQFSVEGKPAGWDKIDGIRLSLWKGKGKNCSFLLRRFSATENLVGIVVPDDLPENETTSYRTAETFEKLLSPYGIQIDRLTASSIERGGIGNRKLIILPHLPILSNEGYEVLNRYMKQGGKLFVCYRIPKAIETTLGIKQGTYYKPQKEGTKYASIRFNNTEIDGLPQNVKQASWNITTGVPIGHQAKVIGYWFDESGKNTQHAALFKSDRGIYFSHVPVLDDFNNKSLMVTALLGNLQPKLWNEIMTTSLNQTTQIGHCLTPELLTEHIKETQGADGVEKLKHVNSMQKTIAALLSSGKGHQALLTSRSYRQKLSELYLRGEPSRKVEARAFWEHAGTGAYPGDWDRSLKELSEAGFNMIIPNMLWGTAAHYKSDVLPRSDTYEKYGDQIEQCVKAAKKYGMEVHVWKVNFNSYHRTPKEHLEKLEKEGRLQVDIDGKVQPWLNPAHPKNQELEKQAMLEVVRNYDVAGIHFDYIRYPNSSMSFDGYSRKKFEKEANLKVKNWPRDCYRGGILEEQYTNFRAKQITKLVKAVSKEARKIKPNIKISAAVFRDYPGCRKSVAQDWVLWTKEGYIDFLCHMDYTGNDQQYAKWLKDQRKLVGKDFLLYPGIGASSSRSTLFSDRVAGQIRLSRQLGANGFTIFNYNEATAKRVIPGLKLGTLKTKAVPPHRK